MAETLDARTVREWGQRYSNWGRWGPDDELGTLNFITHDRVLAAASLPRSGRVVSCTLPFDEKGPPRGAHHGPIHDPPFSGVDPRDESTALESGTRWEPLASASYDGLAYNDRAVSQLPVHGARAASIDRFCDGVVGRAVLLDLPRHLRCPWLDSATRILPGDLDACAESSGVTIDTGDILLVRTGLLSRCFVESSWEDYCGGPAPGLSLHCARWLHERQVAAVATDTWCVEAIPHETEGWAMPLHRIALRDMGLLFGEIFHLDRLAEACAEDGRYAFLFTAPPLPHGAALGSPLNPLAIK